jgi:muramoyltetrapeptide carboxypeptidase
MIKIPPYLKAGDTIGITCPAGSVTMEDMQPMLEKIKEWGFEIKVGNTVGSTFHTFSSSDDERTSELQEMLDDDNIDAILFARGGYGVVRIIDNINFTKYNQNPKWLLGYSDITCLHSHIHTQFNIATIHAHMCGGYKPQSYDEVSTQSIYNTLIGNPISYTINTHPLNKHGKAKGVLLGGNLALLSDLIGTKSDIDTTGKILLIEDIGEYAYNIDRMMWQLLRSKKLLNLAGLIVGGFTDTKNNDTPFFLDIYELIFEKIRGYNYPVCFNFPVGHQAANVALKFGIEYTLDVHDEVTLAETTFTT